MNYIEIKLWKCQDSTKPAWYKNVTCQSKAAIDAHFQYETMSMPFVNGLFAIEDYEQPSKTFIDDRVFFEINPNQIKKANLFIQQSEANLEDDILQLGQSKNIIFHQIANVQTYDDDYTDKDGYLVAVYIRYDKYYDYYERKVNDILMLMGDIGGLYHAFIIIGSMLVGFFTQKYFLTKIFKRIYLFRSEGTNNENIKPTSVIAKVKCSSSSSLYAANSGIIDPNSSCRTILGGFNGGVELVMEEEDLE